MIEKMVAVEKCNCGNPLCVNDRAMVLASEMTSTLYKTINTMPGFINTDQRFAMMLRTVTFMAGFLYSDCPYLKAELQELVTDIESIVSKISNVGERNVSDSQVPFYWHGEGPHEPN